ncbi:MAG: EF-P beta-lysylation protein EpmB [Gammaproteobacteria bacterium]|nr:EF-P beta-lysylation protein EpmB [Gammaproteobacteria bacterium]
MIPRSRISEELNDWRAELRNAYRDPVKLLEALDIEAASIGLSNAAAAGFAFRVPHAYAARMRRGDPNDPLLRQVLPLQEETESREGYSSDPVGEFALLRDGSLIHKYRGRALLVLTGTCAVNCRYCFRRAFPYGETVGQERLRRAFDRIAADTSLSEIILSGGDPLVLDDAALGHVLTALDAIGHVRRVRIHTRLPVVLPSRITDALLDVLNGSSTQTIIVIHVNHPREIDDRTVAALARCRAAGITLLNQSVLLRGVNDDAEVLTELSHALFDAGVLPYYVNLLDRVSGTAHFEVPDDRASIIEGELRARLPGYLVPLFVREIPGAASKVPLNALTSGGDRA